MIEPKNINEQQNLIYDETFYAEESHKTQASNVEEIITNFIFVKEEYVSLLKDWSYTLQTNLDSIAHSVVFRVKKPDSLRNKIMKKIQTKESYKDIDVNNYTKIVTDLGGMRILLLNQSNWGFIDNLITRLCNHKSNCMITEKIAYLPRDMFQIDKIALTKSGFQIPKIEDKQYTSLHYTLKVIIDKKEYFIEIQVRSLADEQYAEIEHEVRYKSNSKYNPLVSATLRNLARTAGVMNYLSAKAFEEIKNEFRVELPNDDLEEFDIQVLIRNMSNDINCPEVLKIVSYDMTLESINNNLIILSISNPGLLNSANTEESIIYLTNYINNNTHNMNYSVGFVLRELS